MLRGGLVQSTSGVYVSAAYMGMARSSGSGPVPSPAHC